MNKRQQWLDLAERCKKATGPDREIDVLMVLACGIPQAFFGDKFGTTYVDGPHCFQDRATWGGDGRSYTAPELTGSLDAITALIERELPGFYWLAETRATPLGDRTAEGVITNGKTFMNGLHRGADVFAFTPATALCAAFCRMMAGRAE